MLLRNVTGGIAMKKTWLCLAVIALAVVDKVAAGSPVRVYRPG